jgi:ribosomal protein S18 acetylase RimI-like enzyme
MMKASFNLPGFTLRPFTLNDLADFIELGLPTCAFMHGRPGIGMEAMRKRFASFVKEQAFDPESSIFVVESADGRIVAQIWLRSTVNRFNGLSELWVWDLTVHKDFQSRGIGRALLAFAKDRAEELGAAELWLLVSSENARALRVYEQTGLRAGGHLMTASLNAPPETPNQIRVDQAMLRPLTASDVKSLHKLWRAASLPFRPDGRDREDRLAIHLSLPHAGGWGAFVEGELVAAALISNDGRKGWIERAATRPDHRRAGLGRALLAACVQTLKESGALVIGALIEEENAPSRRLFESLGFVDSASIRYYSLRDYPAC